MANTPGTDLKIEDVLSSVARMRMTLPSLTGKEQSVAQQILNLKTQIRGLTITEVASANDVSEATVVKVAQKLGFSGFRDLKRVLSHYFQLPVADLHQEINPNDDAETSARKVFSTSIQALQETLSVLDIQQFERAIDAFYHARRRDLYGVGGSAIVAEDASHKFLRIGIRCAAYSDAHLMAMSASLLGKGDLALGVSHSGRTSAVIEALTLARKNGAVTIAVTNYLNSPLTQCSDLVLHSTSRGSALTSENAAARIAQLCLIDALFVGVAQREYNRAIANLEKTMSSVEAKRVR